MKLLIGNVFGSQNRGDGLLLDSLLQAVRVSRFREATVLAIAHFPQSERLRHPDVTWYRSPTRSYAPGKLRRRLENVIFTVLCTAQMSALLRPAARVLSPAWMNDAIDGIEDCDVYIASAGGYLLDVNVSMYANLLQIMLAKSYGKPVLLAPQTIGPMKGNLAQFATGVVLRRCDLICVREGYSYDYAIGTLGIDSERLIRSTDIAFEYDLGRRSDCSTILREIGLSDGEKFIGCTVVDWNFKYSKNPESAREAYKRAIVEVIKELGARTGLRTVLFNQVEADAVVSAEVASLCGGCCLYDPEHRSTEDLAAMIGSAAVFVGSRFHSCVFALLGGVPTVSLSYTYKSTGIMDDLGLSDRCFAIDKFSPAAVSSLVESMLASRSVESERVRRGVSALSYPLFSETLNSYDANRAGNRLLPVAQSGA